MGKILYLECNSGISGDMTTETPLDLRADRQALEGASESLGVDGYHLYFGRKVVYGLNALDFDVHSETDGYGHNHAYTHQREDVYECVDSYEHSEIHEYCHEHKHERSHEHGDGHSCSHTHRNPHDIYHIIDHLNPGERVKEVTQAMLHIVAKAEPKAHGLLVEQIHSYEVGAIGSTVDIISMTVCMNNLGVGDVVISALSEGHGRVRCQHGVLPAPILATANVTSSYGFKLHFTDNDGEVVMLTGAAIAAALRTRDRPSTSCRPLKMGTRTGNKAFKQANVLRVMPLENSQDEDHTMWMLETNLDDCTGEILGLTMETFLDAGAADVWYTPIHMKKDRPVYVMSALCREPSIEAMEEIIPIQTTTVRAHRYPTERAVLERSEIQAETSYGPVDVRMCAYKGKKLFYPEHEGIRCICMEQGVDFQIVYHQVRRKTEENRQD